MDAFTAGYLANLASALTGYMIDRAKAKLRRQLKGSEAEQALERSLQAGLVALLATASAQSPDQTRHLSGIFERLFRDEQIGEEVGEELALLLAGEALLEIGLVGVRREEAGQALLKRLQQWLGTAMRADQLLEPREWAATGDVLARAGADNQERNFLLFQLLRPRGG